MNRQDEGPIFAGEPSGCAWLHFRRSMLSDLIGLHIIPGGRVGGSFVNGD